MWVRKEKFELTGKRFGRLTVIGKADHKNKGGSMLWVCKCDCGNYKEYTTRQLTSTKSERVVSCGCYREAKAPPNSRTHGQSKTRLYSIWHGMKERCENPKRLEFPRYGGRGIYVCDEWHKFEAFRDWAISNGYDDNLFIDRINNDGNYEPSNCRWTTALENVMNRRNSIHVEINGCQFSMKELSEKYNIPYNTLFSRYSRGKRGVELIS